MALFLRPDRGNVFQNHTNFKCQLGVELQQLPEDKYCKSVRSVDAGCLVNKDGEVIEDNNVKTGQKTYLTLGDVRAGQYHLLIEPNPKLSIKCQIRGPRLLEPREETTLTYMLKADSPIELNDFDYLFRLYILD